MQLHPQERVAKYTESGHWGHPAWHLRVAHWAAQHPDRTAVVDPPNRTNFTDGAPRSLTWAELKAYVDSFAAVLQGAGVREDDVIAVQLPNTVELVATYLAVTSLGAIVTPFPVAYREYEIQQLSRLAGASAIVTASRIASRRPADDLLAGPDVYPPGHVFVFGHEAPRATVGLDDAILANPPQAELIAYRSQHEFSANDCVTIAWTSGTESTPKGVPRCVNDWQVMALASIEPAEMTCDEVILNPFPMVNMAGIGGALVPWLTTGGTLVQHHPFDADVLINQIAEQRVTYSALPPALLTALLRNPKIDPSTFDSVRVFASGSAPLSPQMIVDWRERFGVEILNTYGSNEGCSLTGDPKTIPDPVQRANLFPRIGSKDVDFGRAYATQFEIRLVDPATGQEIDEAGTVGELRIKSPGVFAGYLKGTTSVDPFDESGFYRSGDLFEYVRDQRGALRFLRYVDRAKDMIARGGMKISPAEIEMLLSDHPGISEVAIVGVPDDRLGERARAVVVPVSGAHVSLDSIIDHLRAKKVATYKLPEDLLVTTELPRNPIGKVVKSRLRR